MSSKSIYSFKNDYSPSNLSFIPYTYVIKHKKSGKCYYGAKYSSNANPELFFKHYFTSSNIVHLLLENEGIEGFDFEIRKCFKNVADCLKWEQTVLRRLNVKHKDIWLNKDQHQQSANNLNKILISNEELNICIRWPKDIEIPKGWIKGNITTKNKKISYSNRKWYHDPLTGKNYHIDPSKADLFKLISGRNAKNTKSNSEKLKKRNLININNGLENKMISINEPIPEGWIKGKLFSGIIRITNGIENRHFKISPGIKIPDGYWKGKTNLEKVNRKVPKKFKHITNGTIDCLLYENEQMPNGFYYKAVSNINKIFYCCPPTPKIIINNGIKSIKHPKHMPIPKGWTLGYVKKQKLTLKSKLSVFKNIFTAETRLFSSDFKNDNWKKYNQSKFNQSKSAPNKGRIRIVNLSSGKIKYIKPNDKLPNGYDFYTNIK
jgi:uncharacterized protein YbdZ (MbtH family)